MLLRALYWKVKKWIAHPSAEASRSSSSSCSGIHGEAMPTEKSWRSRTTELKAETVRFHAIWLHVLISECRMTSPVVRSMSNRSRMSSADAT
jgi:hypothetical protein